MTLISPSSGTLDVKVTEEDGRVNNFRVSAASTPFLTRQGQVRYKLAAGQPRTSMSHQTENETFFSNEVSGDAVKYLTVRRPADFG